jgi:endonuclease-3
MTLVKTSVVQEIFRNFEKGNPHPRTELIYTTPFSFLVAVILSAQAKDKAVNTTLEPILAQVETPEKIVEWGLENVTNAFHSLNYYRSKSRNIFELAKILCEHYNSELPLQFEQLIKLPGVGPKTANVVLAVLANADYIAVDTHVFRVAKRLGLSEAKNPLAMEKELYERIPQIFWSRTNHWLVLHGRYICQARQPHCSECVQQRLCPFYENSSKKKKR